ncbi:MAG: methyl-accepting chemotaxis protein [Desulfobulbaceae bacterium]|nr:methyl-accepting chemotaxis protein [Desulfobulbaceae bacterium]
MTLSFFAQSLKTKLYGLVLFGVVIIAVLVGTGIHYYGNINKANTTKADFNRLITILQDTRIAEKTYLQFFSEEMKGKFEQLGVDTGQAFETVSKKNSDPEIAKHLSSAKDLFGQYQQIFREVVKTHGQQEQLKKDMMQPLLRALELLGVIQSDLEAHQASLQMEGRDLSATENEMLNIIRDCKIGFLQLQNLQFQFLLSGDAALTSTFKKLADAIANNNIPALHETAVALQNAKSIEPVKEIKGTVKIFLQLIEQSQAMGVKERDAIKQLDYAGKKAIEPVDAVVSLTNTIIAKQTKAAVVAIYIIVGIGIMAFLVLSFFLITAITRPLQQVVAGLKDIAEGEGDLTNRLDVQSQDEMGELAKWFNVFIEKIQAVIRDVAQNAGHLQGSSQQLLGIANQMSSGADQTSGKANTVAAAGEEMSANMGSMAEAMSEASGNVSMVAAAIEEMTSTITQIADNAEKASKITAGAVKQTENASLQISELGESAKDIGKVIETITDISEQVNLLALNATIEAARAGESGKGFAVVANEIKELARQTAHATSEIKQRVEGIQNSTRGTVAEITTITKVVNEVNQIVGVIAGAVEEQSAATREIASNISQASMGISEVNQNVSQGSEVSAQIAQDISEVKDAAQKMSGNSTQVNESATNLSRLAGELNAMVNRFKV